MSLLPGGERGNRLSQVLYAGFFIWAGYQGFLNVHRWHAFDGNLATLSNELNVSDEATFRKHFIATLDFNNQTVRPEDIEVAFDEAKNLYRISVRTAWTVDFGVWTLAIPTVRETWIKNRPYMPPS